MFAAVYDSLNSAAEKAGIAGLRTALLARASGDALAILPPDRAGFGIRRAKAVERRTG